MEMHTPDYPLIADHGLIGDLHTCALVTTDGTVDWLCAPRFDSPSIFGSLLDRQRGGYFRIAPKAEQFNREQLYIPGTAILVTRFLTESGVGEVIDFMPISPSRSSTTAHQLVRMVRCVRGRMTFAIDLAPRFDYGRENHELHLTTDGGVFETSSATFAISIVREPDDERLAQIETSDADVHGEVELIAGQTRGVLLETGPDAHPHPVRPDHVWRMYEETMAFWKSWIGQSTYRGRWREIVDRSAITLKLMTYAPSGGIVAAPTGGLPEQLGGERNWDYRYTWVRDASFSVYSLLELGFTEEAAALGRWLGDRVAEQAGDASGPLKIMYRVDGSSDLVETSLTHWEGYRGSAPVRIGNGAAGQLQLDIYGEAIDSLYQGERRGLQVGYEGWTQVRDLLGWVAENWDQPEDGIWESRGGRKDYTYGRVMCWVALDRGIRMAWEHGRPAPIDRWRDARDAIYEQVMTKGWNPDRRAFVQHYGSDVLDSSLLRMPVVGFVSPTDPRWLSTLEAMDEELVTDSLVYRYNPAASPDGLSGDEGTFSLCTFAYVNALAASGKLEKAQLAFEKMLTYANHLGLYGEEIGLTGEQLGNYPQAFTHLSLIDAAITLDRKLNERSDGHVDGRSNGKVDGVGYRLPTAQPSRTPAGADG
jgi:GH15 family glucan-1,4-alpha-glucosidase